MLYQFLLNFVDSFSFLNVFKYLTFRTGLSFFTSLIIVLIIGGTFIKFFSKQKILNPIRNDGPEDHIVKKIGTPTMGGVIILIGLLISVLFWADLSNLNVLFCLYIAISFGLLGAFDDYKKIKYSNSSGISSKLKLSFQIILAIIGVSFYVYFNDYQDLTNLYFPFFKNLIINLGWFFIPFSIFVIIGSSNAVNLTDGLDGLASGLLAICFTVFAAIAYISGRVDFSDYLNIIYLPGSGELTIFTAACVGACIGYLWFNAAPAEVFMGDVGSLSTGAALGTLSILLKKEFLLVIIGGVFVAEALSVILQVSYYRYTKIKYGEPKKLFLMAPFHHHFELKGYPESRIVIRFWIVGLLLALLTLATFKIR